LCWVLESKPIKNLFCVLYVPLLLAIIQLFSRHISKACRKRTLQSWVVGILDSCCLVILWECQTCQNRVFAHSTSVTTVKFQKPFKNHKLFYALACYISKCSSYSVEEVCNKIVPRLGGVTTKGYWQVLSDVRWYNRCMTSVIGLREIYIIQLYIICAKKVVVEELVVCLCLLHDTANKAFRMTYRQKLSYPKPSLQTLLLQTWHLIMVTQLLEGFGWRILPASTNPTQFYIIHMRRRGRSTCIHKLGFSLW
jgi:hypothetical protein